MPSHHRSRSSVDRVLDLLAGLDENQVELLLQEAECTVSSNVPVSKAIDMFERPTPMLAQPQPLRRKFLASLSPRKQSEMRRRQSKRASSAREPLATDTRPKPAVETTRSSSKTPRAYKRISRPIFPLPPASATPDICDMLAAYLSDASTQPKDPSSSPVPPSVFSSPTPARTPFLRDSSKESDAPELDLLEPSPVRTSRVPIIFGAPLKQPVRNISGIFEVLNDFGSPNA